MYTTILIFFVAIALAASAPVDEDAKARIFENEYTNDGRGNYKFSYQTSNGLTRDETGEVVNTGKENEHIAVRGVYSYIDADGNKVVVEYTADENGYQQTVLEQPDVSFALPANVIASLIG